VFEDKVFDVDATLAELTKKASERAGLIRDQNLDLAIPRGSPTMLAGNPRDSLVSGGHDAVDSADTASAKGP